MKYTLLELTQAVLSSMDSDEVTSINDTVESLQVVEVIKTVYDDIISRSDLQTSKTLFNLTESGLPSKPTLMTKPEDIDKLEWLKYNAIQDGDTAPNWVYLRYLPPEMYIDMMHSQNLDESWIESFNHTFPDGSNVLFYYRNDRSPENYTTFDDGTLFFDAYDSALDTYLLGSKTLCYGSRVSDFQSVDSYVPNLHPQQFSLLLNEAKSLAWAELKQTVHQKAEQTARRNWVHLQKTRNQVPTSDRFDGGNHNFDKLPNFSRNR